MTESVDLAGMRLTHTSPFELTSIDRDDARLEVFVAQTAAEQEVTTFDQGQEKFDATLVSLHSRGTRTCECSLVHLAPTTLQHDLELEMEAVLKPLPAQREDDPAGGAEPDQPADGAEADEPESITAKLSLDLRLAAERK